MNILGLGLPELIIIALVVLLFFGKDRLPGLFRAIGSSINELKEGLSGEKNEEIKSTQQKTEQDEPHESTANTNRTDVS